MSENYYKNKFHELLDTLNYVIHKNGLSRDWGIPMATDEHTFNELLEVTEKFFVENTPEILQAIELNITTNVADVEMKGMAVKAFATNMVEWFKDSGGVNFVTVDLTDPNDKFATYAITMQKHMHPDTTPAQRITELEMENLMLKTHIKQIGG